MNIYQQASEEEYQKHCTTYGTFDKDLIFLARVAEADLSQHEGEEEREDERLFSFLDSCLKEPPNWLTFEHVLNGKHQFRLIILKSWLQLGYLNWIQVARLPLNAFI